MPVFEQQNEMKALIVLLIVPMLPESGNAYKLFWAMKEKNCRAKVTDLAH